MNLRDIGLEIGSIFHSPSTGLVQPAATAPQTVQAVSTNLADEVPAGADYPGN